jgi:adenylyltransferase/sulfurtransferase
MIDVPLSPDQVRRYARHILLPELGGRGQERLLAATVTTDDAGGAAAVGLLYLAAAGVGTLVIRDDGVVGPLDRYLYEAADLGRPRLDAARDRLGALNGDVRVLLRGEARFQLRVEDVEDPVDQLERGARAAGRLIREILA